MKNITLTFIILLIATFTFAQAPQMINYQGVARDLLGAPVPNQNISLRMSVLSGSPSGTNEYAETHNLTTNNLGLFSIQIGNGSVQSGNFSTIAWGENSHYLQTEMDENGGTSYALTGTTQMVSVPYALYSKNSASSYWKMDTITPSAIYYNHNVSVVDNNSSANRFIYNSVCNTDSTSGYIFFMDKGDAWSGASQENGPMISISRQEGTNPTEQDRVQFIRNAFGLRICLSNPPVGQAQVPQTRMFIHENGNVGITTSTPVYNLEVNGTAGKPGGGSWTTASDIRLKTNINTYQDGLSNLLKINPVIFQYNEKSGFDSDKEYVGIIAQDLQKIAPYMVGEFERSGEKYLDVDNSAMTYMLINSVKELNNKIEKLEVENHKISELEDKIKKLEGMLLQMANK